MAALYGTEVTALDTNPQDKVDPGRWNGKVHVYGFTWTGDAAQNDTVELVRLPPGIRIIVGRIDYTAFGAGVTLDLGNATTENAYRNALDVSVAGQAGFAETTALGMMGAIQTSGISLIAKFEAANPDSGTLRGYIVYSVE